jgi:hypothetical protein
MRNAFTSLYASEACHPVNHLLQSLVCYTPTTVQEKAVSDYLYQRKVMYIRELDAWQIVHKAFLEAVKMDHLRIAFLADAGVPHMRPQVLS